MPDPVLQAVRHVHHGKDERAARWLPFHVAEQGGEATVLQAMPLKMILCHLGFTALLSNSQNYEAGLAAGLRFYVAEQGGEAKVLRATAEEREAARRRGFNTEVDSLFCFGYDLESRSHPFVSRLPRSGRRPSGFEFEVEQHSIPNFRC